jgi:crotonobetainyl-CoA:carnitine CoA-transferase CaiB-like acyl-CoA transferase
LRRWLSTRTRAEVFEEAQAWRIPLVPVLEGPEVLADEQFRARRFWQLDEAGRPIPRSPFHVLPPSANADGAPFVGSRRSGLLRRSLSDVRVLDLGAMWAGPYCGRLLAALGAEVIKIEGPTRRDGPRPAEDVACQGLFADLNRDKRSLVIDLGRGEGREVFLHLARASDVVIENFSPRVMPNFGLDFATLSNANPSLVMLSMPAFGSSGPWAQYVSYGSGLELATGLAHWDANGRPSPAPVAYLDFLAGTYGAVGVLASLVARDTAGEGAHVEAAQREVAAQLLRAAALGGRRGPPRLLDPAAAVADPRLRVRRLFARPTGAGRPCHHYARPPWRLVGLPHRPARPAPAFGADSRRILQRVAGLGPRTIEDLLRAGVAVQHGSGAER